MAGNKTALVIGATGLVGSHLLDQLLNNDTYTLVNVIGRSNTGLKHKKLNEINLSMDEMEKAEKSFRVDEVFCCIGTTIRQAGSKENFRAVDLTITEKAAKLSKKNNVGSFVLVSSIGADHRSNNFYLKTKGEAEQKVISEYFPLTIIMRPSILIGKRKHFRLGELFGKVFMILIEPFLILGLKKYKGAKAENVAKEMINAASIKPQGLHILFGPYSE